MAKKEKDEIDKVIEDVILSRAFIVAEIESSGKVVGKIDCPVCEKGTLRYSQANINKHIHAVCSTLGCVKWME